MVEILTGLALLALMWFLADSALKFAAGISVRQNRKANKRHR